MDFIVFYLVFIVVFEFINCKDEVKFVVLFIKICEEDFLLVCE